MRISAYKILYLKFFNVRYNINIWKRNANNKIKNYENEKKNKWMK